MSSARRRVKKIDIRDRVSVEDNLDVIRRPPKTIVRELKQQINSVIMTNRKRFGMYPRRKVAA